MGTPLPQDLPQRRQHPFQNAARAAFHQQDGRGLGLAAGEKIAHSFEYSVAAKREGWRKDTCGIVGLHAFRENTGGACVRSGHRSFPLAPNIEGDKILLGVPLTTEPGDYSVELSFGDQVGDERTATIKLTVEPLAAATSSVPPVVLLEGFEGSGCPMSSISTGTFGNLQFYLSLPPNSNPNIYFFENCTECPSCSIEQLGAYLGVFLNSLGVPQVDVVAHSMGGLIIRAYLSGKQAASGAFSPPTGQKIRKAVFVASPHFGAFATNFDLAEIFASGTQTDEMRPGSQFVWDLGTWNQFGDDLRGVDAISIVGNAATSGQSDGVVETTSASLDFWALGRTRVVDYCHIPASAYLGLAGWYLDCEEPGIARCGYHGASDVRCGLVVLVE